MSSLYRKYRPQTFQEVVGQEHVVHTLQNALKHKRVSHAYLFAGPRGTGKTTIARLLAKELGVSGIDVVEIDAASNRGIDEARSLKEKVQVVPAGSPYKVFIIDEVHMLTKEAFNALLKTLEEPPAHAIFILATTEPDKIPDTIISRTQRFDFRKISVKAITTLLTEISEKEGSKITPEAASLIAMHSEGALRDALSLLDQLTHTSESRDVTADDVRNTLGIPSFAHVQKILDSLLKKDLNGLASVENLTEQGVDFYLFLAHLIEYVRSLLLSISDPTFVATNFSETEGKVFESQKTLCHKGELIRLLGYLFQAREDMKVTPISSLPLEIAFIRFIDETGRKTEATPPQATAQPPISRVNDSHKVDVSDKTPSTMAPLAPMENSVPQEIINVEPLGSNVEVKDILSRWGEALGQVKKVNFAIGGFLRGGTPVEINQDSIVIACKFPFHKEKISDRKNRSQIEDVLQKMFGRKMHVECVLESELSKDQKLKLETNTREQEVIITQNALEMFEGKMIGE